MLLAYVDESHGPSRYWVAALVCPEGTLVPLARALDAVVARASRAHAGVNPLAELHGYSLLHGMHDWASLKPLPRARLGVYHEALRAIGGSGAHLIIRGVDVPRLRTRYPGGRHPHEVTLAHLLERVDECAETLGHHVLVIADEIDRADTYRRNLWHFQRFATTGYRSRRLEHIVDTMHFAPSDASRLVQAVDLVVFLHHRMESDQARDSRAQRANSRLWEQVAHLVWHAHCWKP